MSLRKNRKKYSVLVDTEKVGENIKKVTEEISTRVIGQSRAITHILRLFASEEVSLRDPNRPIGVMILAGPSGCGKTLTAKETAKAFLGSLKNHSDYPLTYVQCSNLSQEHQTASLIGSPPGYVGYGDLPILHWINLEKHHFFIKIEKEMEECQSPELQQAVKKRLLTAKQIINVVQHDGWQSKRGRAYLRVWLKNTFELYYPLKSLILFDEIEKAHPNVWNLLLGILEEGQLQLATGEITDFRNSFIIMTTNTGSREIQGLMERKIGFALPHEDEVMKQEKLDQAIYEEAKKAFEKMFPAEFIGRLGKEIVVFRTLNRDDYLKILEIFLSEIQSRLSGKKKYPPPILIDYTPAFKEFLVKRGTSQKYGARILRDVVKKYVIDSLSFAFSSGELIGGDKVLFDLENEKPVIRRQPRSKNQKLNNPITDGKTLEINQKESSF